MLAVTINAGDQIRQRLPLNLWQYLSSLLSVVQGTVDVMTFNADGAVKNRVSLSGVGANVVVAAPSFVARLEVAAVGARV